MSGNVAPSGQHSERSSPRRPAVADYAVLLLDVLGQNSALMRYRTAADLERGGPNAQVMIDETVAPVKELRKALSEANSHVNAPRPMPSGHKLSQTDEATFRQYRPQSFEVYSFADTVVVYTPLVDNAGKFSIGGLFGLLIQSVGVMLVYGTKIPLRGAIECGWGYVFGEKDLYGYAAAKTHQLESESAQYPRVVVGPCAIENLEELRQSSDDTMNKRLAEDCFKFLAIDQDGLWFVDYLGQEAGAAASDLDVGFVKLAERGRTFAAREHERFIKNGNSKLALRYALLRQYYESRLGA